MSIAVLFRYIKPEVSPKKDPEGFVKGAMKFVKEHVKPRDRVAMMVSGGVDSTVSATLFHLEIGDRLYVTHLDTGFMRLMDGREESEIIAERFSEFENFKLINARELFYDKVMGISDAEQKRLGFRRAYEISTDRQMAKSECNVMAQGTIMPDIIETEGGIKSQHNVQLKFTKVERVVEPLAGLYKDEVRRVAEFLCSKYNMKVLKDAPRRQPFPGPGLSVRAVGAITPEKLDIEKRANDVVERMIEEHTRRRFGVNLYINDRTGEQIPFQSFAATLDDTFIKTEEVMPLLREKTGRSIRCKILNANVTGVREGKRVYSHPLCIESDSELDYDTLERLGREIPSDTQFSRVLYRVGSKIGSLGYTVAIRSVNSSDAMKASINEIPTETLERIADEIVKRCDVREVYWDISPKPPATIEYE
ncbi:MAG: GMP synthase (glutamine-hydrolyzing) [Nitrososphaerales archaeon]